MLARQAVLWLLIVLPGLLVVAVAGYFALQDWAVLQREMATFAAVARQPGSGLRELFLAEAGQNIHRLNLFAEGDWCLLGAIYAGLGILGLVLLPGKPPACAS